LVEASRTIGAEMLAVGAGRGGTAEIRAWIATHFAGAERYLGSG
jgi:hypothetical protein